jgi:hypothetical protein
MQLSGEMGKAPAYRSSFHALTSIAQTEGVRNLYKGLSAGLLRQATYPNSNYFIILFYTNAPPRPHHTTPPHHHTTTPPHHHTTTPPHLHTSTPPHHRTTPHTHTSHTPHHTYALSLFTLLISLDII